MRQPVAVEIPRSPHGLMALTLSDIETLFAANGDRMYTGEPVTQLEHALQSADAAERDGASQELVMAAFLHDLGHLINDQGETPTLRGIDDRHEYFALPFLRALSPTAVLAADPSACRCEALPVCPRRRPDRPARVLGELVGRFEAQPRTAGRHFHDAEADAFIAKPYAADAVRLRLWDDLAKSLTHRRRRSDVTWRLPNE